MKTTVLLLLSFIILKTSTAQKDLPSLQLSIGKSWHGTGDLDGVAIDLSYLHPITKRLDFSNGLTTTIHHGKDKGLNFLFPGASPDNRLLTFTTGGIQLTSLMNYAILSFPGVKLKAIGGGIFRYQSTSLPEILSYYQEQRYFPEPFYVIDKRGKQNTFSAGYTFGLGVLVKILPKYQAGIKAMFQNDTNADAITQISFTLGRSL